MPATENYASIIIVRYMPDRCNGAPRYDPWPTTVMYRILVEGAEVSLHGSLQRSRATLKICESITAFSDWDTTSNSKISTWDVWCHAESLSVHYRPGFGREWYESPQWRPVLSLSRKGWDWGRFCSLKPNRTCCYQAPPAAREIVISRPGYLYLRKRVFWFLLIDLYTSLRHSSWW